MKPALLLELAHLYYVESLDPSNDSIERARLVKIAIALHKKARRR